MHHTPMFTPLAAIIFAILSLIAVALHLFNQKRTDKLVPIGATGLARMFKQTERNMAYMCAIMIMMSFHALGFLEGQLPTASGWIIVAFQAFASYRVFNRSRHLYGL